MSASSKKKLRKEQNAAQLTEKQLTEQKEAKKLKNYSIAFVAVILAVVITGLAVMGVTAYQTSGISERSTTALTVGEHKISAAQLNYFFMDGINELYTNWYNTYGTYASTYLQFMMGLDVTQPLSEQIYDAEAGTTFADYFTEIAVDSAVAAYAAYDRAMAEGYQLTDEENDSVELTLHEIEHTAESNNYSSMAKYLKAMYGNGASEDSFREYLELLVLAQRYNQDIYEGLTYEQADLDAHNAEHYNDYSSFTYNTFYLDVDDFLLCTAKEGDDEHEHTEQELSKAVADAKAAADALVAAAPTDAEAFDAAIKELETYAEDESAYCSQIDDLIFSSITNEELAAWLSDSARKAGDMTVLTNETTSTDEDGNETSTVSSYSVIQFLERNDNEMSLVDVRHVLKSFENGTTDTTTGTTIYSDESKQAAMDFITGLQTSWVEGGATEESFIDLAKLNSTDTGSASNGGLYEDVYPGQMVTNFNDWCFDESRQAGDYGIVETEYGVHLLYFVGHTGTTYRNYMIESELREADYQAWYEDLMDTAEYTVADTSKLALDMVISR